MSPRAMQAALRRPSSSLLSSFISAGTAATPGAPILPTRNCSSRSHPHTGAPESTRAHWRCRAQTTGYRYVAFLSLLGAVEVAHRSKAQDCTNGCRAPGTILPANPASAGLLHPHQAIPCPATAHKALARTERARAFPRLASPSDGNQVSYNAYSSNPTPVSRTCECAPQHTRSVFALLISPVDNQIHNLLRFI